MPKSRGPDIVMTSDNPMTAIDAARKKISTPPPPVAELCQAAGVTERTYYRNLSGETAPYASTLRKLRRALDGIIKEARWA